MDPLRRWYTHVWCCDFEFHQPRGAHPTPLCVAAYDVLQGESFTAWLDGAPPVTPPWQPTPETLFVMYYGSAELSCFLALDWPLPARILDLYVEFRALTCGRTVPCGHSLLGALAAFGIEGLAAVEKEDMRELAQRGGPYTAAERQALLTYCQTDVDALARLLPAMAPHLDLPRALLRARYMCAAARMEWTGTPVDVETLTELRAQWDVIRHRLAREVNRTCGVFVPTGTVLDPQSRVGAAVLQTAAARGVDPYQLAAAVDHVWHEAQALYGETIAARRAARTRTGLTPAQMARWENAGHDASSWPGLDDMAAALAEELPALGLRANPWAAEADTTTDYAAHLWQLLRHADEHLPAKDAPDLLQRAADLVAADPEGEAWDGPMTFSTARFEQYLACHDIPWPRLTSGALALDDATFREMARAYPEEIGPIREVRHALSQLKLNDLAVGHDGRNRCLLSAFRSRTGRNQPSNSAYIFGPSCWLRSLIQPEPGQAVAYMDWSQQELAIAAALSQDQAMMDAYQSGDFYLAFAKMAGAAPPEATKETHAAVREHFKVVALGVLYGLSEQGIARRLGVPLCHGRLLLQHHKEVFRTFWTWADLVEMQGMLGGHLRTVFGWPVHVETGVNPRSLRNFPMQANGAEMLRLACCLTTERGIRVCAPVHDALLVEASDEEIDGVVVQTQAAMEEASALVLPGFPLRAEAKIVRYPERYRDPRGSGMWGLVQSLLKEVGEEVPF
jgi:DNA polymerase family A